MVQFRRVYDDTTNSVYALLDGFTRLICVLFSIGIINQMNNHANPFQILRFSLVHAPLL